MRVWSKFVGVQAALFAGFFGMMGLGLGMYLLTGSRLFVSWAWLTLQVSVAVTGALLLARRWKLGVFEEKEFGHRGDEDRFEGWN